jgi:hypothetical protein
MNRETTKVPRLINPEYIKKIVKQEPFKIRIKKYLSLDLIILIFFLLFLIFFLINCRDGIFKNIDMDPIPYTFSQIK